MVCLVRTADARSVHLQPATSASICTGKISMARVGSSSSKPRNLSASARATVPPESHPRPGHAPARFSASSTGTYSVSRHMLLQPQPEGNVVEPPEVGGERMLHSRGKLRAARRSCTTSVLR